jgi:hypothetical protein
VSCSNDPSWIALLSAGIWMSARVTWLEEAMGQEANGAGWALLTFKSARVERAGTLPLHEFLRYLSEEKLLSSDEYLASIEFGNEIVGGRGTTWVTALSVVPPP